MDCVDHDMFQLRDVGEAAERVAESALAATVGLVQCLERFKESNEALHSDNAVLCGLHSIEPPRPILIGDCGMSPQIRTQRRKKRRVITIKTPDVECQV